MKLSEKQQDLFDEIKDLTSNGGRLSIDPHEVPTAKVLVLSFKEPPSKG